MKRFTTAIATLSTALLLGTSASAMLATHIDHSPREAALGEISSQTHGTKSSITPLFTVNLRVGDQQSPSGVTSFQNLAATDLVNGGRISREIR